MKERLGDERAQIIPAGIDFEQFKPQSIEESRLELELPLENKKYVLVLWGGGEARHEKRLDVIKTAVEIARQKDPAIELIVVTDKPHDMIPLYMNACDVLLLVSDAEGSPNVVKEAMACNLPVVSVPVGDVPELIGDTEGCYLCSQDPADVAEKLLLVLDNPRRTNGRAKVEYLELGNVAGRIVSLYEEVLRSKRHHGRRRAL
jgi:glycosyltransferase involved in cell wall biosynthesis